MKRFLITLLCITFALPLFSYSLSVPPFPTSHAQIEAVLTSDVGDEPIQEARLYFKLPTTDVLAYVEMQKEKEDWKATIPAQFIVPGTFSYFVEIKDTKDALHRIPDTDWETMRIDEAEKIPELELVFPKNGTLSQNTEQILIVRLPYEVGITSLEATLQGNPVTIISSQNVWITLRAKPSGVGSQPLELIIIDQMGYEWKQILDLMVEPKEVEPWFVVESEHYADASISYEGEFAWDSLDIKDMDYSYSLPLELTVGGSARVKLGPLTVMGTVGLHHKDSVLGLVDSLPNVLLADYHDMIALYNPINFQNEFTFTADRVREYDSGNVINLKVDLFDGMLSYEFGDQEITMQEHTIKNLGFRGTSITLNLSPFKFTMSKGLSDKGLFEQAWPQQFFGLQGGLWFKGGFRLQGNLSFISDFQGRFDDIKGVDTPPIKTLYKLNDVAPQQNMVLGLSSGFAGENLEVSGDLGFSMYVSDSSGVVDIQQMVNDLADDFNVSTASLDRYFELLNTVHGVFPVLDYFPINMGLIGTAIDRELWGMMYRLEVAYKPWNIKLWFYKADKMYRSLGASAPNDVLDIGTAWKHTIIGGDFAFDFAFKRNSIPDILAHDFLSLVLDQSTINLITLENPFTADAKFSQTAKLGYTTPKFGLFGTYGFIYTALYEYTNDPKNLFALTSDDNSKLKHTFEGSWNGGPYSIGSMKASFDLKGTANFNQPFIVSSVAKNADDWYWDFVVGTAPKFDFGSLKVKLGFKQSWSLVVGTDTKRQYELGFQLPKGFIDTWNITTKVNETSIGNTLQKLVFEVGTDLAKQIDFLQLKLEFTTGFSYDAVQNAFAFDKAKAKTTIRGSVSL